MFAALVLYNLGVVLSVGAQYTESMALFDRAIAMLARVCTLPGHKVSQDELVTKFKAHASTKYLMFNTMRSIDAASLDDLLEPAVLLAQCIAARAETRFLASDLKGATSIQLGKSLPSDKKGAQSETDELSTELSNAFNSYLDSHPNLRLSLAPDDGGGGATAKRGGSSRGVSRGGLSLTTALIPQGTAGTDSSADLLQAQEVLGPFRRLLGACSGGAKSMAVTTETITAMKVLRQAGRSSAATAGKKTPGAVSGGVGFVLPRLSSAENVLAATEDSTTRLPAFENALKNLPKCSNSVRSAMLVVPESFQPQSLTLSPSEAGAPPRSSGRQGGKGMDADTYTATVVEWALMICEGASLGMVGVPMIAMPKDFSERRRDKERERLRAEAKGAREKLQDCLINNKPGNPAILMSVYSTMAKLCMHLGLRSDAGGHILIFEDLAANLSQPRTIALAKKFRVDYEEWLGDATTPSTAPSQAKLKRMQALLGFVKAYYEAGKVCEDNNLHRDSCKRLMNMYTDISNIPDPLGTPPRELSTLEDLVMYTDTQIEENEQNDILWMKGFSRARAIVVMREMKRIGAPDAPLEERKASTPGEGPTAELTTAAAAAGVVAGADGEQQPVSPLGSPGQIKESMSFDSAGGSFSPVAGVGDGEAEAEQPLSGDTANTADVIA
jgi:hypothetical protein